VSVPADRSDSRKHAELTLTHAAQNCCEVSDEAVALARKLIKVDDQRLAALDREAALERERDGYLERVGEVNIERQRQEVRAIEAEDKLVAALGREAALWQEAEHPFDASEFAAIRERAERAETRADTLEAALREIAQTVEGNPHAHQWIAEVARGALGLSSPTREQT
jgi:hypothetical protein